jgi:hypothetical protein
VLKALHDPRLRGASLYLLRVRCPVDDRSGIVATHAVGHVDQDLAVESITDLFDDRLDGAVRHGQDDHLRGLNRLAVRRGALASDLAREGLGLVRAGRRHDQVVPRR